MKWKNNEKAKDTQKFFCSFDFWKSLSGADHQLDCFDTLVFWEKCFIVCAVLVAIGSGMLDSPFLCALVGTISYLYATQGKPSTEHQ